MKDPRPDLDCDGVCHRVAEDLVAAVMQAIPGPVPRSTLEYIWIPVLQGVTEHG